MERDVIIIGAGVVGCSIALGLNRSGLKTLNVDVLPAAGYGSTSHSSAIVRPFYSHVTSAAVAHESRSRWLDWGGFLGSQDERGLARYTESGGSSWSARETNLCMRTTSLRWTALASSIRCSMPGD